MTSPTDRTLAAHQDGVQAYVAGSPSGVPEAVALLLDAVVAHVPDGGEVLELGSGPGREALYLEHRGLRVDRTDATPAFVDRPRQGGHPARVLDVRHGGLGGMFDAVLANAVLLHLDRQDPVLALQTCHRATRPDGVLALSPKEGDGEAWSEAKLGSPRWFVFWREGPLRRALSDAGWTVVSSAMWRAGSLCARRERCGLRPVRREPVVRPPCPVGCAGTRGASISSRSWSGDLRGAHAWSSYRPALRR